MGPAHSRERIYDMQPAWLLGQNNPSPLELISQFCPNAGPRAIGLMFIMLHFSLTWVLIFSVPHSALTLITVY